MLIKSADLLINQRINPDWFFLAQKDNPRNFDW